MSIFVKNMIINQIRFQHEAGSKQSRAEQSLLAALLKMEAIYYFKAWVGSPRATWDYIPEDRTLHHRCKNFVFYKIIFSAIILIRKLKYTNH
jgi:hypothetical protein